MVLIEKLGGLLGRKPSLNEIAGHIADRISALEQNRGNFRLDGDVEGIEACNGAIQDLRAQALANGLNRDKYPGLYR